MKRAFSFKVFARRAAFALLGLMLLIQLVPYGRRHTNPPVGKEPPWDHAATRELAVRACFDCHSHETRWLWYSHIAPVSWLLQSHVEEGRRDLNFSNWPAGSRHLKDTSEEIAEGEMPPADYRLMHPAARLSPEEKQRLIRGLEALRESVPPQPERGAAQHGD